MISLRGNHFNYLCSPRNETQCLVTFITWIGKASFVCLFGHKFERSNAWGTCLRVVNSHVITSNLDDLPVLGSCMHLLMIDSLVSALHLNQYVGQGRPAWVAGHRPLNGRTPHRSAMHLGRSAHSIAVFRLSDYHWIRRRSVVGRSARGRTRGARPVFDTCCAHGIDVAAKETHSGRRISVRQLVD